VVYRGSGVGFVGMGQAVRGCGRGHVACPARRLMLRRNLPELRSDEGIHWADVLLRLYKRRREAAQEGAGTHEASASERQCSGSGDSIAQIPEPRRVRDKEHLRFVASLPCVVCGRAPGQPSLLIPCLFQALVGQSDASAAASLGVALAATPARYARSLYSPCRTGSALQLHRRSVLSAVVR
jgi:hypothetical protein